MDDVVPNIDFSPNGSNDPQYSLERVDIDGQGYWLRHSHTSI